MLFIFVCFRKNDNFFFFSLQSFLENRYVGKMPTIGKIPELKNIMMSCEPLFKVFAKQIITKGCFTESITNSVTISSIYSSQKTLTL